MKLRVKVSVKVNLKVSVEVSIRGNVEAVTGFHLAKYRQSHATCSKQQRALLFVLQ